MKMPSQSLNWPQQQMKSKWVGKKKEGRGRELWCGVQKSKSPKIKSDLFAKTPKTETEAGDAIWNVKLMQTLPAESAGQL